MTYRAERVSPCRIAVTATMAPDQVAAEREKILAGWQRAARIDGFRKGKAPRHLIERRFTREIEEDLTEGLVRTAFAEARQGEKLRPAGPLEIKKSELSDDGSFAMDLELDVYPEIELADPEGFTPPPFDLEPAPQEVEAALRQLQERQATWEPVESGTVEEGMLVEAEVWGRPERGDEFHEERSLFVVGAGEVYQEIDAAVRGKAAGEELEVERVLGPEAGEREGVRVAYRILVKSVRRKRMPEVDDAFASSLGVADLETLKKKVAERLHHDKVHQRRDVWRGALVDFLAQGHEVPVPGRVLEEETRRELINLAEGFARRGIDPEKHVDWDKLEPEVRGRVERRLRAELVLDTLAERRGIAVRDREVDAEVERQSRAIGVPFAELKGNLAKQDGLDRVRAVLRRERATDQVLARFEGDEAGHRHG